ncbi:hypothetical protein IQ07DRAFT_395738 [Pyrenochaeta sp. DS3sAY3a]|nr:hypothetical protein IQ07DRAFT_395738 [Pyrenochaeta sp. DS3sAY3a]
MAERRASSAQKGRQVVKGEGEGEGVNAVRLGCRGERQQDNRLTGCRLALEATRTRADVCDPDSPRASTAVAAVARNEPDASRTRPGLCARPDLAGQRPCHPSRLPSWPLHICRLDAHTPVTTFHHSPAAKCQRPAKPRRRCGRGCATVCFRLSLLLRSPLQPHGRERAAKRAPAGPDASFSSQACLSVVLDRSIRSLSSTMLHRGTCFSRYCTASLQHAPLQRHLSLLHVC